MASKKQASGEQDEQQQDTTGKQARGEQRSDTPAWMKPDYTGPLSANQAVWRRKNLRTK